MEAGKESRQQELRTEWILNRQDFKFVVEKLGFVPTVDLFASRINIQLETFMSNRSDPKCIVVYSLTQSSLGLEIYVLPLFTCIPRVMQKMWKDKAVGIWVYPEWPNQIWYNQLSQLITSCSSTYIGLTCSTNEEYRRTSNQQNATPKSCTGLRRVAELLHNQKKFKHWWFR